VGDLNGDGILDVITPNRIGFTVSTFLGNGDGTFRSPNIFPVQGRGAGFVAVGDFNGDGMADLAAANGQANLPVLLATTSVLSRTSVNFGKVNVGSSSTVKVALTNIGNASFSINRIGVSGKDASEFVESNNCGKSLAAGARCAITIVFKPQSTAYYTATVRVSDSAVSPPQTIYVSGFGVN
jgi:hypothetical protein